MRLGGMDILNSIVGLLAITSTLTGILSVMYAVSIVIFVISWILYHRIPWTHKRWKSEAIMESVKSFYSFARIFHAGITYSLITLIFLTLLVGLTAKSAPSMLANDVAEYVWSSNGWNVNTITSSTIPSEFATVKKDDQPFAVILDKTTIKAAPLRKILYKIVEKYNGIYVQMGSILFFVIFVICMVLYPTELIADARLKKGEDS